MWDYEISSERQFANSLTKPASRQLLADRLRYGLVKFTWDPSFTASREKTVNQRAQSRLELTPNEPTTTTTYNEPKIQLTTETTIVESFAIAASPFVYVLTFLMQLVKSMLNHPSYNQFYLTVAGCRLSESRITKKFVP